MRQALLLLALSGCGKQYADVVGPFTGVTYRFTVDQLLLPMQRSDYADDLNGDLRIDNQLGNIAGALAGQKDLTSAIDDLLGSGVLTPVVEITTDDPALRNDRTVGIRFIGADGEYADEMGGALADGVLTSNPTRLTRVPAAATIHLPLFKYADPVVVAAIGLEVRLVADDTGFSGTLNGAFPASTDMMPAWVSIAQMLAANPKEFPSLVDVFDPDRDGSFTFDEFSQAGLVRNLMAPDVQLTDGMGHWAPSLTNEQKDSLSFGLWIHLRPCVVGTCNAGPTNTCQDRILEGNEADVDCGSACLACAGGSHCSVDADCQSAQCVAGVCNPPNCSDGLQDGGETGIDCGWNCPPCPVGSGCRFDVDCAVGFCLGVCTVPMCSDRINDGDEVDVDCGGHCPLCPSGALCRGDSDCESKHCVGITCPTWFNCTKGACE